MSLLSRAERVECMEFAQTQPLNASCTIAMALRKYKMSEIKNCSFPDWTSSNDLYHPYCPLKAMLVSVVDCYRLC